MGKIAIDRERCKACYLCIGVCPKKIIAAADDYNQNGYAPARVSDMGMCTGCALCAEMCPDICITVWRERRPESRSDA